MRHPVHVSHIYVTKASHWEARSNLTGGCGHKHRNERTAARCLDRMRKLYHERRYGKRREANV